jgi:adenosine deaminase
VRAPSRSCAGRRSGTGSSRSHHPTTTVTSCGASTPRAARAPGAAAGCAARPPESRAVSPHPLGDELTELHVHLGGSVDPADLWRISHEQGIRLPTKDYWEFVDLITLARGRKRTFEDLLALYEWTELIQSSPIAVEESVYSVVSGAYRKANITTLELRYNPMKRNRGGERDLDHIIMASVRGLDRAHLEYPVRAGLIFCLDRKFDHALNEIIAEKAIAYRHRGVVGIDIAGGKNPAFRYRDYAAVFRKAKKAGLGITVHAGEDDDWRSVDEVVRYLDPDRIGHGIHAAQEPALCDRLAAKGILLEICPSSNLDSNVVRDADELRGFIATFRKHKVRFSFNTDGPEMLGTTLRDELRAAVRHGFVTKDELKQCGKWALEASFVRRNGGS